MIPVCIGSNQQLGLQEGTMVFLRLTWNRRQAENMGSITFKLNITLKWNIQQLQEEPDEG